MRLAADAMPSCPVSGAIAITPVRLVVWAGWFKHIDVPLNHPVLAEVEIRSDRPGQVTPLVERTRTWATVGPGAESAAHAWIEHCA